MDATRVELKQAFPKRSNEDRGQIDRELGFWTCILNCTKVMHKLMQGGPQAVQQRERLKKLMRKKMESWPRTLNDTGNKGEAEKEDRWRKYVEELGMKSKEQHEEMIGQAGVSKRKAVARKKEEVQSELKKWVMEAVEDNGASKAHRVAAPDKKMPIEEREEVEEGQGGKSHVLCKPEEVVEYHAKQWGTLWRAEDKEWMEEKRKWIEEWKEYVTSTMDQKVSITEDMMRSAVLGFPNKRA
jgi:hypothetical protein